MKIDWHKPEYDEAVTRWDIIDKCVFGIGVEDFLIELNPTDKTIDNTRRNQQYRERAVFYAFAGYTYRGMIGAAFKHEPSVDVPGQAEYILNNADGAGTTLYQQAQKTLGDVVRKGRAGLFVTFPPTQAASIADVQSGKAVATIHHIEPQQIINWRYEQVGSKRRLSLVVFVHNEAVVKPDGFEEATEPRYRVLKLVDGAYVDETWRKKEQATTDGVQFELVGEPVMPTNSAGQPLDYIPFQFVGSQNNDADIDRAPMYDLVRINIGHYRNSADFEDSVFFAGQPQAWASGIDATYMQQFKDQNMYIGSRYLFAVPPGEEFAFAAAPANPLVKEAMTQKALDMIALGARLITPGSAVKTATQAADESAVQHSVLSLCVKNVAEAYEAALRFVCGFMGGDPEAVEVEMSTDFGVNIADPQALAAMVAAWNQGAIPTPELWSWLRAHGYLPHDKTDEDLMGEQNEFGQSDNGSAVTVNPQPAPRGGSNLSEDTL